MAAIRQFLAGTIWILFFIVVKKLPIPSFKEFLWLTLLAFLMFVFGNGLSTWSLKHISTGFSALIGALYPITVVVIEFFFFKKSNLNKLTLLGLLLGIAGIGIVFYENAFHNNQSHFILGTILSAVAMIAWSIGSMVIARNKININPYYSTGWQMLISSVMLLVMAMIKEPLIPLGEISATGWGALAYLIVAGSLITFGAFIYSMKYLPPAIFSLYAYLNPLVAMFIGSWVHHNEKLTSNIIIGSVVTLVGVFTVNYSAKGKEQIMEQ